MNKDKLQRILHSLSNQSSGMGDAFKSVEKEMERVVNKLREETEAKTVVEAKKKIKELKEEMNSAISSLATIIENLKNDLDKNDKNLFTSVNMRFSKLSETIVDFKNSNTEHIKQLANEVEKLKTEKPIEMPDFKGLIYNTEVAFGKMISEIKEENDILVKEQKEQSESFDKKIKELDEKIHLGNFFGSSRGGGNANRRIDVRSSLISNRYADINFLPGSVMGLVATNNDVTKQADFTISGIPSSIASAIIGGSDTQVQYNNNGAFGGGSGLTWNNSTSVLSATNLTFPAFTQGSIPFQLSSSVLGQNNANLFWDNTGNLLRVPTIVGGTATTSDLTLQTTTGIGADGADTHFLVGNNGATEAMTILNNGNIGIGTASPDGKLDLS